MARSRKKKSAKDVEGRLVSVAETVMTAAKSNRDPVFYIPTRSLSNVNFNTKKGIIEMGKAKQERSFFNVGMAKKFRWSLLVLTRWGRLM